MCWHPGLRRAITALLASVLGSLATASTDVPAECGPPPPKALAELGRFLFFDTQLSGPGYIACASCHEPARAFSDGRPVAIGITGQRHPRNSQGLSNVGCLKVLTWSDPTQVDLAAQSAIPLFSREPIEMASAGRRDEILERLKINIAYRERFAAAFPESGGRIDWPSIQLALAAFQRSLLSFDSPYDRFRRGETPLGADARRGLALFESERLGCSDCHRPPLFTDANRADPYHNTGLYNLDGRGALPPGPQGLIEHTGRAEDRGKFRTPSLRNVAFTAPYMHDGSIATLGEVIDHYAAGGRAALRGEPSPLTDRRIRGFTLEIGQKRDLKAFLIALSDASFMAEQRFNSPFRLIEPSLPPNAGDADAQDAPRPAADRHPRRSPVPSSPAR